MTENDPLSADRKRSICIFSLSCIPDDPRVRRQGDTFHEAGWEVHAFGINQPKSTLPPWSVYPGNWSPEPETTKDDNHPVVDVPVTTEGGDNAVGETGALGVGDCNNTLYSTEGEIVASDGAVPVGRVAALAASMKQRLPFSLYKFMRTLVVALVNMYWLFKGWVYIIRRWVSVLRRWLFIFKWTVLSIPRRMITLARRIVYFISYYSMRLLPFASAKLGRYTKRDYYTEFAVFRHEYRIARQAMRDPQSALDGYFRHPVIQQLYDAAKGVKADIYLANDWHTIPIALRLARENGGYLCYDTHEYALEEYLQHWSWRKTRLPVVRAVEGIGLRTAIVSSTVSAGIGEDMARVYGLDRPLMEIRNVQNYTEVTYKPVQGDKIRVLYHGIIVKARGLETCVRSVRLWRDEFEFLMRGPVSDEFKAELIQIARENGVEDRIKFLPPVPMLELIKSAASEADIGISTPPKLSRHHIYALPNKFFEYIQAGLALCIADLPDMGRIVRQHDLGLLIPEVEEQHIANTINAFTRESVNRYKLNSLKAAKELNWEVEAQKLLSAYETALTQRGR